MTFREEVARRQALEGNPFKAQMERMYAERFKRCEHCGRRVKDVFRIHDGLYFCSKTCFQAHY